MRRRVESQSDLEACRWPNLNEPQCGGGTSCSESSGPPGGAAPCDSGKLPASVAKGGCRVQCGAGRPGPRLLHARLTEAPRVTTTNGALSEAASGSAPPRPSPERRSGQWQLTSKRGERAAAGREQPASEPDSKKNP